MKIEKVHFTVTPLAFIPVGALKYEEFFNVAEELTPGRILHVYHAWRHLAWEVHHGLRRTIKVNPSYRKQNYYHRIELYSFEYFSALI